MSVGYGSIHGEVWFFLNKMQQHLQDASCNAPRNLFAWSQIRMVSLYDIREQVVEQMWVGA